MNELDSLKKWLEGKFDSITVGLMREAAHDLGIVMVLAQNMHEDASAEFLGEVTHFGVSGNMLAHLLTLAYGVGKGSIEPLARNEEATPQIAIVNMKGANTIH